MVLELYQLKVYNCRNFRNFMFFVNNGKIAKSVAVSLSSNGRRAHKKEVRLIVYIWAFSSYIVASSVQSLKCEMRLTTAERWKLGIERRKEQERRSVNPCPSPKHYSLPYIIWRENTNRIKDKLSLTGCIWLFMFTYQVYE